LVTTPFLLAAHLKKIFYALEGTGTSCYCCMPLQMWFKYPQFDHFSFKVLASAEIRLEKKQK